MSNLVNRKQNLLILLSEFISEKQASDPTSSAGLHVAFANKINIAKSSLSSMKTGARPIGDKVARQIESLTGKPHGWLDENRSAVAIKEISLDTYLSLAKKEFERATPLERQSLIQSTRERMRAKTSNSTN